MNKCVDYLKLTLKNDDDFVVRELDSGKKDKIYIAFFESLVDSTSVNSFIIQNIHNYLNYNKKIKDIKSLLGGPKCSSIDSEEKIFYYLNNGFTVVIYKNEMYAIETKGNLDRGISTSQTEQNMYGPKDAFCENYQKNLGVLKRRIKNKKLKIETVDRGEYTKSKAAIIYLEDKVDPQSLEILKEQFNKFKDREVIDSYDLMNEISKNSVFPTILKTEKPAIAARYILKGYISYRCKI